MTAQDLKANLSWPSVLGLFFSWTRSQHISNKGSGSRYFFRLYKPADLCCNYLPIFIAGKVALGGCKWMGVSLFPEDLIYKIRQCWLCSVVCGSIPHWLIEEWDFCLLLEHIFFSSSIQLPFSHHFPPGWAQFVWKGPSVKTGIVSTYPKFSVNWHFLKLTYLVIWRTSLIEISAGRSIDWVLA